MMLDWLIIGGGIHGTHLSLYLTQRKGVPPACVRVLDPQLEPLALWQQLTANTGMAFLRSSHAHNLHFDPFSLVTFARTKAGEPLAHFIEPYARPSLDLFNTHSARLIERYQLTELRLTGRAESLRRLAEGWRVETERGSLAARRIILAIGNTEQPFWPIWARQAKAIGVPIHHIFDSNFRRDALPNSAHVLVVGGGITAVQSAISIAIAPVSSPNKVTLLMRHPLRVHSFDADTGWVTPRYLDGFYRESDFDRRRAIITAARHRGSVPTDVAHELQQAVLSGLIVRRMDEVATVIGQPPMATLVSGERINADHIILATGFDSARPGGAWLDAVIAHEGLTTASDGYPSVDKQLCWTRGLYVMGPLAELEIGPVARNIIGARLAAERIGTAI